MGARPIEIVLGTADGIHVLGARAEPHLAGHEVRGLAPDGDVWWCLVDRRSVHVRRRGARWKRVAALDDADDAGPLEGLCLLPSEHGLLVGTARARLTRLVDGRFERLAGFDAAPGRASWFTPWGGPPDTRSLARGADGALYVNVHVGGVLRSRDGGRSWKQTMDIGADAHDVAAHPEQPRWLFAATAAGLGVSRDAGSTWTYETGGLHATYQRAVAITRDRVLVSSSQDERGREAAVYWRPLRGRRTMVKCETGLPRWFDDNVNTHCLAGRGTLAAIGTSDGRVFVSEDQGDAWRQVGEGLPRVMCLRIRGG
jgi:hypothetical protein